MVESIDCSRTFCTEPSIGECHNRSSFSSKLTDDVGYSHCGSSIAATNVFVLCEKKIIMSCRLRLICITVSVLWSVVRGLSESLLSVCGDSHNGDDLIDVGIIWPFCRRSRIVFSCLLFDDRPMNYFDQYQMKRRFYFAGFSVATTLSSIHLWAWSLVQALIVEPCK